MSKGVVQDRILVRELHLAAERDRQDARHELLVPRTHDVRLGGRLYFRGLLRPEVDDGILRLFGPQILAVGHQVDVPADLRGEGADRNPGQQQ